MTIKDIAISALLIAVGTSYFALMLQKEQVCVKANPASEGVGPVRLAGHL